MKFETTARRLREAMANKGMRQQDLADASGVSKSNISHYCNGNHAPNSFMAYKLAKALDVAPDWLMATDEAPDYMVIEKTPLAELIETMSAAQKDRLYEIAKQIKNEKS